MLGNKLGVFLGFFGGALGAFALFYLLFVVPEGESSALTLYGNVDVRQTSPGFRVGGKLLAVHFEEGDPVQAGDLLAALDPEVYQSQLAQAQSRLQALEVDLKNQTQQLERRQGLVASRSVSEEEYDSKNLELQGVQFRYQEALAAVEEASLRVSDTELRAVEPGIVLTRIEEPGTVVSPGQAILSLSLPKPLWVRTFVAEPDLGRIRPGMKAWVRTDTPGNPEYEGQVGFISPVAEFTPKSVQTTQLRTDLVYQVRILIPTPDAGLRQGMPVTVKIPL